MIATAILCGLVPMIGITLRNSAIVTTRETRVLQALSTWPEYLHDCSTVLAYMFSTIGCIMLLAILAAIDMRITGNKRIVIRDIVVSATPILYVTGIKWVVERPRPVTSIGSGLLPGDPSFPSGHTAAAVIVSVMMILTVRNWARKRFSDAEWDRVRVFPSQIGIRCRSACFRGRLLATPSRPAFSDRCDYFGGDLSADLIRGLVRMG